ncbi:positive regulation of adiponectin secretion [Mactra antiquata]
MKVFIRIILSILKRKDLNNNVKLSCNSFYIFDNVASLLLVSGSYLNHVKYVVHTCYIDFSIVTIMFGINICFITCSFLLLTTQSKSAEPLGDSDGSRFVYEYKLMERLIQLENENTQLAKRLTALETAQSKTKSRVSAHLRLSKTTHLANTDRVMYDIEVSNIGGAYSLNEGLFDTPISGIYLIHVNTCLNIGGKWIDLDIIKDGGIIGRVFSGDSAYHSCGSMLLSVYLNTHEKVWINRVAGSATNLNQDHGWNTLTIVLIEQY